MIKTELKCLILATIHLLKGSGKLYYRVIKTFEYMNASMIYNYRCSEFGQLTLKSDCTCPGYPLIYECTVFGEQAGTTVWTGSAFNCTSREISLFHSDYGSTAEGMAYGECGNIQGQSVKTINGNTTSSERGYVSQLIIRVRLDTFGKNIEYQYDDGHSSKLVGQTTVTVTATTGNIVLTISWACVMSSKLTSTYSSLPPA